MKTLSTACLALAALAAFSSARAEQPQTLTAHIGDIAFEAGDDDIVLVPLGSSFSLSASTKGSTAWPPPKTRIDRLAITCESFKPGQAQVLEQRDFARSTCDVTFERGHKDMGAAPEARYTLDKDAAENRFEITRVQGKAYEGRFTFRLRDAHGQSLKVDDGRFQVEDRQL